MVEPSVSTKGKLIGELRETKFKEGLVCPHCSSHHVVRYGKYKSRKRYKCKDCSWRAYTTYAKEKGVAHYWLKPDKGIYTIKGIYHIQNVKILQTIKRLA